MHSLRHIQNTIIMMSGYMFPCFSYFSPCVKIIPWDTFGGGYNLAVTSGYSQTTLISVGGLTFSTPLRTTPVGAPFLPAYPNNFNRHFQHTFCNNYPGNETSVRLFNCNKVPFTITFCKNYHLEKKPLQSRAPLLMLTK